MIRGLAEIIPHTPPCIFLGVTQDLMPFKSSNRVEFVQTHRSSASKHNCCQWAHENCTSDTSDECRAASTLHSPFVSNLIRKR
jgi:hypothetical protein